MSENSCLLVKEVDCDNVVIAEEFKTAVIVTEDQPVLFVACEQGPAGQDGFGIQEFSSGPVANANSVVADSVATAVYRSAKWLVTLSDSAGSLYKSYEVFAVHNGTIAEYTVYGLIGDNISVSTDVDIVAGDLRIVVTNNHGVDITIKVMRIVTTV